MRKNKGQIYELTISNDKKRVARNDLERTNDTERMGKYKR